MCALGSTALGQSKGHKRKKQEEEKKAQEKKEDTVPLPVGHEAKGLVLPDYDLRRHPEQPICRRSRETAG